MSVVWVHLIPSLGGALVLLQLQSTIGALVRRCHCLSLAASASQLFPTMVLWLLTISIGHKGGHTSVWSETTRLCLSAFFCSPTAVGCPAIAVPLPRLIPGIAPVGAAW